MKYTDSTAWQPIMWYFVFFFCPLSNVFFSDQLTFFFSSLFCLLFKKSALTRQKCLLHNLTVNLWLKKQLLETTQYWNNFS